MQSLMLRFTNIACLEGVRELTFRPGVNILTGANGVGKSELQKAACAALAGAGALNGTVTRAPDGTPTSLVASVEEVDAQGNAHTLAKTRARAASLETASIPSADTDNLTKFLTGNGFSDPVTADKARIQTLFTLLPESGHATRADILVFVGGETNAKALFSEDELSTLAGQPVLTIHEILKKRIAAKRSQAEEEGKKQAGAADALRKQLATVALPAHAPEAVTDEQLQAASSAQTDALIRAREVSAACKARQSAEEQLDAVKAVRASREAPDVGALQAAAAAAQERMDAAEKEVIRLERQLNLARQVLAGAKADAAHAAKAVEDGERARLAWDREAEMLSQPISGPTKAEADAAQEAADAAASQLARLTQAAADYADYQRSKDTRASLSASYQAASDASVQNLTSAKQWQKRTELCDAALGAVLASKGLPSGLTVSNGRLYAQVQEADGKNVTKLFSACSEGQQTRIMLELAIAAFPGKAVSLQPAWWASLTPSSQLAFAQQALEAGVFVLTGKPTDAPALGLEYLP